MARKATKATTYYQMLGVQPEVSSTEIKKAYRNLVKSHHPDQNYHGKTSRQRTQANEYMVQLNEAYETLIDKRKRAEYDSTILGRRARVAVKQPVQSSLDEEEAREKFLRQIFNPSRSGIVRILSKYKQQLTNLSQDIYDDQLIANFECYVDEIEDVLRHSANELSSKDVPVTLRAAVQMMRYSIAQAADGLEETRRFCQNYDYDHLHMAGNLFREAIDLSKKASALVKQ